jgi:hypothetical protein
LRSGFPLCANVLPRFVILGVNRESTNAGDVRGLQCSLHRVLEHSGAEAFGLPGCRNGIIGTPLTNSFAGIARSRLAYEAADAGLLSPELAAGIRR